MVTGHRFDIYEDIGCYPVTVNVWLNYPLVACWPIVIGLISATYAGKLTALSFPQIDLRVLYPALSLRAFRVRQTQFKELLSSNASLTQNRYFRLMALATTELICTLPLSIYIVVLNIQNGISPYLGWDDLHFGFSRVDQIPFVIWSLDHGLVVALQLARWLVVACALVFFIFFGFAEEARKHYRALFERILKHIPQFNAFRPRKGQLMSEKNVLPQYVLLPKNLLP